MTMVFVLTIINNVNNICKNENYWSLLITRYSLLIARNTNTSIYPTTFLVRTASVRKQDDL